MIKIGNLTFAYSPGGFRLEIPAFNLAAGERLAVAGPSGSGKTTLLDLIASIRTPVSGTLEVDRVAVSSLPDAARRAFRLQRIGFVFQDFELFDYLTVLDNILHPFRISYALRLDLVMNALYFSQDQPELISMLDSQEIENSSLATAIPLKFRLTAREAPIVGTTLDYFDFSTRRLRASGKRSTGALSARWSSTGKRPCADCVGSNLSSQARPERITV